MVAGFFPWWISGWKMKRPWLDWAPLRVVGALVLVVAVALLIQAFVRFVSEGLGTPAPVAPTERLVVGGLYRYVRNPMYIAIVAAIFGQALLLGQLSLLWYGLFIALLQAAFVRWHEEPALRRRFGHDYEVYSRAVPSWLPRLRPWIQDSAPLS
jgi:protein-S-isoprenylcysteine O-methyltransferase Ste14